MATRDEFTEVERRLVGIRDGDDVDQAAVEALLDSADPVDRRAGLKGLVLAATGEYDCFEEEVPSLSPHLTDANTDVRFNALQAAIELLPTRRELLDDAPEIAARLHDDSDRVAEKALDALSVVAKQDAAAVSDAAERVADYLDADRSEVRKRAVWFFTVVAQERPADATPAVPRLAELVGETYEAPGFTGDEWQTPLAHEPTRRDVVAHSHEERDRHMTIREFSAEVLVAVARERPEAVRPHVPAFRDLLDHSDPHVCRHALRVITAFGGERPAVVAEAADEILSLLDRDADEVVAAAVKALGVLAGEAPERVVPELFDHRERLADLLEHEEPHVRGSAVGLLSHVAERDRTAVEPVADAVVDLLDDEHGVVRGNAVWALESLGTDEAASALRDRRPDESDDEVRASIDHALDSIDAADS